MTFLQKALAFTTLLASLGEAYAKLDTSTSNNVVVYWGQNSFRGSGELAQQPLSYYCKDPNIDVIVMAFLMQVNGNGGAPEYDFSVTSGACDTLPGTGLKNCPKIGEDITACQKQGKTILLSIGGATYTEGGFPSESAAVEGANLLWQTFGPPSSSSSSSGNSTKAKAQVYRPFGDASIDGFDFDFEANVQNTLPFATQLRKLMDADSSTKRFLTAAPQCPYPDAANKDILNGPVSVDAVWVQFYNNWCGLNSFQDGTANQSAFNFDQWDTWASTVSHNKDVKVMLGVPANTGAAGSGYVPASQLVPIIQFSKQYKSFGGVMMWDVTQAYGNSGFLDAVRGALTKSASRVMRRTLRFKERW